MFKTLLAISTGSALGALLRWILSIKLNTFITQLPLGTLLSNLIAGYIIGLCIAFFSQTHLLSSEWKLFTITGFCGGLSTFSTFSAEIVTLIQRHQYAWVATMVGIHVIGSVLMTLAGLATWYKLYPQ